MFPYLRWLAARLAGRDLPPFEPDDPDFGVRDPRRSGPGGRTDAIAVDEPREDVAVDARARRPVL